MRNHMRCACFLACRRGSRRWMPDPRPRGLFLTGLAAGAAVNTSLLAAPFFLILTGWCVARAAGSDRRRTIAVARSAGRRWRRFRWHIWRCLRRRRRGSASWNFSSSIERPGRALPKNIASHNLHEILDWVRSIQGAVLVLSSLAGSLFLLRPQGSRFHSAFGWLRRVNRSPLGALLEPCAANMAHVFRSGGSVRQPAGCGGTVPVVRASEVIAMVVQNLCRHDIALFPGARHTGGGGRDIRQARQMGATRGSRANRQRRDGRESSRCTPMTSRSMLRHAAFHRAGWRIRPEP